MKYIFILIIYVSIFFLAACEVPNKSTKEKGATENTNEVYLQKGKSIAATTFTTLSSNLQKAMQSGGVTNAVKYCNVAAYPLVDSLSQIHNAIIRRTSLKVRNPKNKPNPRELKQLQNYQQQREGGETLTPVIENIDGEMVHFYAPIYLLGPCQKCHGKIGETMVSEDYDFIKTRYPKDEAVGYISGDLRGMWRISFER